MIYSVKFGNSANSTCHLYFLWLFNCICLTFPLSFGTYCGSNFISSWVDLFSSQTEEILAIYLHAKFVWISRQFPLTVFMLLFKVAIMKTHLKICLYLQNENPDVWQTFMGAWFITNTKLKIEPLSTCHHIKFRIISFGPPHHKTYWPYLSDCQYGSTVFK